MEQVQNTYYDQPTDDSIIIIREFNSPVSKIRKAWSDPVIIDNWFAPQPFILSSKALSFTDDGSWTFNSIVNEETSISSVADYFTALGLLRFKEEDAFCTPDGRARADNPKLSWSITFESTSNGSAVYCHLFFENQDTLTQFIDKDFKNEFASSHNRLDNYLSSIDF